MQRFQIVDDVPVMHPDGKAKDSSSWYEEMYRGRSRTQELSSVYLEAERELVRQFSATHHLQGPCLEIGCGVGLFADMVPNFIGLEYNLEALLAPGFQGFRRVCGDAISLPFNSGVAQMVFSFNSLEHVAAIDLAFAEIDRVCAAGGFLVLKPAWHCARYVTELVHILPYSQLSFRKKLVKAVLPVLRSFPYKLLTHFPWRLWRLMTAGQRPALRWKKLVPYHGPLWEADTDAEVSLDSHEAILYFTRRNYECLSHRSPVQQLLARHDIVILRKGEEPRLELKALAISPERSPNTKRCV
jgi:SAM-dependent methyltransferase